MDDETVACLATCVGLQIDPAYQADVTRHFRQLLTQAQLVMSVKLPIEMEPAPVFRA